MPTRGRSSSWDALDPMGPNRSGSSAASDSATDRMGSIEGMLPSDVSTTRALARMRLIASLIVLEVLSSVLSVLLPMAGSGFLHDIWGPMSALRAWIHGTEKLCLDTKIM